MLGVLFSFVVAAAPAGFCDCESPKVEVTSPGAENITPVKYSVAATDNVAVAQVELYIDDKRIDQVEKSAPYEWNLNTLPGQHSYYFVALDAAGNQTKTPVRSVNVKPVVVATPVPTPKPTPVPTPVPTPTPSTIPSGYEDESCKGLELKKWPQDASGWTKFTPSERVIYVSAGGGLPADAGSAAVAAKTFSDGVKLLRKGHADHLLLKKGETFSGSALDAQFQGKDADNLMILSSYGTGPRPKIYFSGTDGLLLAGGGTQNVAVIGLDLDASRATGDPYGFRFVASDKKNILIEDNAFRFFHNNISIEAPEGHEIQNVQLRRNQILDARPKTAGHSQGFYVSGVHGILIEQNIFDHNGWQTRGSAPARATKFNHNVYVQSDNKCVVAKENVFSRGSATGIQMRSGGMLTDNFFMENPVQYTWGLVNGGSVEALHIPFGLVGVIANNVSVNATDIDATPDGQRTGQIEISNTKKLFMSNNIAAHHLRGAAAGNGFSIKGTMGGGVHNARIENNIAYDLKEKFNIEGAAWGVVTLKAETVVCDRVDAAGKPVKVTITGSSVYQNGVRLYNACVSGIPKELAGQSINDAGTELISNIFQTGSSDFQNLSSFTKLKLTKIQTAPVKFVSPMRVPPAGWINGVREMTRANWVNIAPQMNQWVRDGFKIAP